MFKFYGIEVELVGAPTDTSACKSCRFGTVLCTNLCPESGEAPYDHCFSVQNGYFKEVKDVHGQSYERTPVWDDYL